MSQRDHWYQRISKLSYQHQLGREGGAAFLQELDVNVLPMVQFYADGKRVEAFPCGPRKIELLREKLEKWQNWRKLEITPVPAGPNKTANSQESETPSKLKLRSKAAGTSRKSSGTAELDTAHDIIERVPLLARLSKAQLDAIVHEGRIATYDAGDVLISEGDIGRRFFVLVKGECDVFELSKLATSSRMPGFSLSPTRTAFGSRTNTLVAGAYFGERALVTNEPRAASIVAATHVVAFIIDRSALAKVDRRVWGENTTPDTLAEILHSTSEGMLWGYERTAPTLDSNLINPNYPFKSSSDYFETAAAPLPVMQRLRLLQSVIRAFDQAAARSPKWGNTAEIIYRKGLVAQLTNYQRQEFEQTFELLDRDRDGSISVTDLAALMIAVGRHPDACELANMINKANPEVEGNKNLELEDFLALMAQAEFSAMFLEAFKLLDPEGHGWVESELLWQMMDVLIPSTTEGHAIPGFSGNKISELIDTFGVSDGHIDYQAFVKIMMQKHD